MNCIYYFAIFMSKTAQAYLSQYKAASPSTKELHIQVTTLLIIEPTLGVQYYELFKQLRITPATPNLLCSFGHRNTFCCFVFQIKYMVNCT